MCRRASTALLKCTSDKRAVCRAHLHHHAPMAWRPVDTQFSRHSARPHAPHRREWGDFIAGPMSSKRTFGPATSDDEPTSSMPNFGDIDQRWRDLGDLAQERAQPANRDAAGRHTRRSFCLVSRTFWGSAPLGPWGSTWVHDLVQGL